MIIYQRCQRHKREHFRYIIFFSYFVKSLVGCNLHLKMEFLNFSFLGVGKLILAGLSYLK
jgi:hypothetical protein